jgi:elongation factor Ts
MASVSIQAIKELRERTQAGMGDCKKALVEAEGNMEKAVEVILKKGKAKSAKRAGRVAAEGEVRTEVFNNGAAAAIVEVNIETDFSARNDKFKNFVGKALSAAKIAPEGTVLAEADYEGKSLAQHASDLTAVVGEKITLRRYARLALPEGTSGFCHSYVHMGGKIGVLLLLEAENQAVAAHAAVKSFADDTAMQIAAMNPRALQRDEVDAAELSKQTEIFEAQLRDDPKPKPEKVWPRIIEGKVNAWFSEIVLLEQESAQHRKQSIGALCKAAGKEAGGALSVNGFVRFELGEGIEKKTDDLRAGVAELLG